MRIAADEDPPVPRFSEYVVGSLAASLTNALPRVYVCPEFWAAICVHPDGVVIDEESPSSLKKAKTRMSPSAVPVGRAIVKPADADDAVVWERYAATTTDLLKQRNRP
jgi:hypothetical protein